MDREKLALLANNVEKFGFGSLWFPEATSFESFSLAAYLLANSNKLIVGTGIANIYARDAVTSAQGHDGLNALLKIDSFWDWALATFPLLRKFAATNLASQSLQ